MIKIQKLAEPRKSGRRGYRPLRRGRQLAEARLTPLVGVTGGGKSEARLLRVPLLAKAEGKVALAEGTTKKKKSVVVALKPKAKSVAQPQKVKAETSVKKKGKAKAEGIINMSPAGSDYIGPLHSLVKASDNIVSDYIDMMVNPWCLKQVRLPDQTITPTAMGVFMANRTYTQSSTTANGPNLMFGIHSRLSQYSATPPGDVPSVYPVSGVFNSQKAYDYSPGSILLPIQFFDNASQSLDNTAQYQSGTTSQGFWGDDFKDLVAETVPWVAAYRCLSLAIRVRIVGLPTSQFMTPGKIYFGQIRYLNSSVPLNEQDWVQLESRGQATHVSMDAVRASGSKTYFATPDGPNKFDFTSVFEPSPGLMTKPTGGGPIDADQWARIFPGSNNVVTNVLPRSLGIVPYDIVPAGTVPGDAMTMAQDAPVADQTMVLLVACFGLQDGVIMEVDYANICELIPTPGAPAGVSTQIQLPNTVAMDRIFAAASVLQELKPRLVQSPGDNTIIGVPQPGMFAPSGANAIVAEGRAVKTHIMRTVDAASGRSRMPRRRGRAEGFWDFDWLKAGSLGPISWDFRSEDEAHKEARLLKAQREANRARYS